MATPSKNASESITPILETMSNMAKNTNVFKEVTTSPSDHSTGKNDKAGTGQKTKTSEVTQVPPQIGETQKPGKARSQATAGPSQAAGSASTSSGDSASASLVRINETLDILTANIQNLTGNMGKMTEDLSTVKQKQDFLEASWKDPNFGYYYDSAQGHFLSSDCAEEEEEGEAFDGPPKKGPDKMAETRHQHRLLQMSRVR